MQTPKSSAARPRLSVAMIVRNEEDVLAESIASVRAIADEIVVLDTGSSDRSGAIARRMGAVVGEAAWSDDFAAARNDCLKMVSGQWVLWLDAGERLAEDSAAELRRFVEQQADSQKVYMLLVQVPPPDATASGEQAVFPRLMPNRPVLWFEGRVRETLRPAMEGAGLQIGFAPGRIVRDARQYDEAIKTRKAQRNLALATQELAETGGSPLRLLLAIGDAYHSLGLHDQARTTFQQAINAAQRGSSEMLEAYYGLLAALEADPFFSHLQLNTCLEALEIFPLDAQLLLALGNQLQKQQQVELAGRAFRAAFSSGQVDLSIWHLSELMEVAAVCLNLTLQMQGFDEEACRVLSQALERQPRSVRLTRHLLELHIKHGRYAEAVEAAGRLGLESDQQKLLRLAIEGACKASERDWTAAQDCLDRAYADGCRDPLLLRWLSIAYLSNGQLDAAKPVLFEWYQQEPNSGELQGYLAVMREYGAAAPQVNDTAAEAATGEVGRRTFRVDPAVTVHVGPPQSPIVSQASSADALV